MVDHKKVAVIGAGVIGLSVATHLLERFPNNVQVTLIADRFTPHTISSDKSGGWIVPIREPLSDVSLENKTTKWFEGTLTRIKNIYNSENESINGIRFLHGYRVIKKGNNIETFKKYFPDFTLIEDAKKVLEFNTECFEKDDQLASFSTYIVSCPIYLPWLLEQFTGLGGISQERKVNDISELGSHYDIIINCTGLGARELVNDQQVYPVTGHMVSVNAPWIKQWINIDPNPIKKSPERTYVLPQNDRVMLGGTNIYPHHQYDASDSEAFERIIQRCTDLYPALKGAKVIEEWKGYRPMRDEVCLEEQNDGSTVVVHCYGHGSYGVTFSWGNAMEVGDIVEKYITSLA